jgi:midasin (ATPase involved in ribosome maturation)
MNLFQAFFRKVFASETTSTIKEEQDFIPWHFDELIKTLLLLSKPAEEQIRLTGLGQTGTDLAEDFDWHYTKSISDFRKKDLIDAQQEAVLNTLQQFIVARYVPENSDFWEDDELLSTHPDWEEIRKLANHCLVALGKAHLDLLVSIDEQAEKNDDGEELIVQTIRIELAEKRGSILINFRTPV